MEVTGVEVPEDFYKLPRIASRLLREVSPDVVISLGWDFTRTIKVEKIAVNVMASDFGGRVVPDNYKHAPRDEEVVKGAPVAYRASLPTDEIVRDMIKNQIPAVASYNAGTHCCNTLMFSFLHNTRRRRTSIRSGHIHIPPIPDMLKKRPDLSTMDLDSELKSITIALQTCARPRMKASA
jgi:pyroglutamyl-peptidase